MPRTRKLTGKTSSDYKHTHFYEVDFDGNGWAYEAYHPKNKNVHHKHEIINWIVQEAQSDCHPNCEGMYGVKGVGSHVHNLEGEENRILTSIRNYTANLKRNRQMNKLKASKKLSTKNRNKIIDRNGITYECPPGSKDITSECKEVGVKSVEMAKPFKPKNPFGISRTKRFIKYDRFVRNQRVRRMIYNKRIRKNNVTN